MATKKKKSKACSFVLQLMDGFEIYKAKRLIKEFDYPMTNENMDKFIEGLSYSEALKLVLKSDKRLSRKKLVAELEQYI